MGIPKFIVTGCVGAVGRIIFKCGMEAAIICATSANPSAVSPRPWEMTRRPDCCAGFVGERVMVVPVLVTEKGDMLLLVVLNAAAFADRRNKEEEVVKRRNVRKIFLWLMRGSKVFISS
jgi:hypothetical protein